MIYFLRKTGQHDMRSTQHQPKSLFITSVPHSKDYLKGKDGQMNDKWQNIQWKIFHVLRHMSLKLWVFTNDLTAAHCATWRSSLPSRWNIKRREIGAFLLLLNYRYAYFLRCWLHQSLLSSELALVIRTDGIETGSSAVSTASHRNDWLLLSRAINHYGTFSLKVMFIKLHDTSINPVTSDIELNIFKSYSNKSQL